MSNFAELRGKSVFVTGHTGFKGSWLCLWLDQLGAKVTGYALAPPTQPSNFVVSEVRQTLERHYEADIRDADTLHDALVQARPDVVLHLAAQTVVKEGYRSPRETFDVNVIGTASLLDGVAKLGRPCSVICVTSDKCYENPEQVWGFRETDAMGGSDPYSASKGAAEILISSYRRSFFPVERLADHGVRLASARAGNVIGGGDWTANALLTDLVEACRLDQTLELRNPNACRPWQHVIPALSGYLTLATRLLTGEDASLCDGWNIGPLPGNELTVYEIAERFAEMWGTGRWKDVSEPGQDHEAGQLRLSIDKALWKLGWKPSWDVDEAIRRTATWYRSYYETTGDTSRGTVGRMREICISQIADYEAACTEPAS